MSAENTPEVTPGELKTAWYEMRSDIERSGLLDPEKKVRIDKVLDRAEEDNQKLVLQEQKLAGQADEIKELKDDLEKKGVEAGEARTRIEALELLHARNSAPSNENFKESPEYKAMNDLCRYGYSRISEEQKQLLRTDSGVEGGFLLSPTELDSSITKTITEIDPIRSISRVRTIASKSLEVPIRNVIPVAAYEGEAETGTDSVPNYAAETLTPFRQTYTTPITIDMLQDSAFDMEAEIAMEAGEAFGFGEGAAFVNGSGFKEPEGFLQNANVIAGAITGGGPFNSANAGDLSVLTGELKVGYNPVYVFNRGTLALIRSFRGDAAAAGDGAGQFLWNPGLNGPVANTIHGFPYVVSQSMPDSDTPGNLAVAFGDFRRGYTIVDRTGMSVVRDDVTAKRRAIVEFTMNRWNTGQVTLSEAITALSIGS
jgi:HK97 family phage major capsid protein